MDLLSCNAYIYGYSHYKMNSDTKRKISMRLKHRNKTATHKWHISRAMKNHPVSDKTKEQISASLKAYYEKKRAASAN